MDLARTRVGGADDVERVSQANLAGKVVKALLTLSEATRRILDHTYNLVLKHLKGDPNKLYIKS
jgi:hypothetical protein